MVICLGEILSKVLALRAILCFALEFTAKIHTQGLKVGFSIIRYNHTFYTGTVAYVMNTATIDWLSSTL